MSVSVKITGTSPKKYVQAVKAHFADFPKAAMRAVTLAGGILQRTAPRGRTGNLRESFMPPTFLRQEKGSILIGLLSSLVYAKKVDEGGLIRPKTMKNLAIPVSQKAKRTIGLWPRHWDTGRLFLIPGKYLPKGKSVLAERKPGKNRGFIVHYVLQKSVNLTPRNYIAEAIPEMRKQIQRSMGEFCTVTIQRAKGSV